MNGDVTVEVVVDSPDQEEHSGGYAFELCRSEWYTACEDVLVSECVMVCLSLLYQCRVCCSTTYHAQFFTNINKYK